MTLCFVQLMSAIETSVMVNIDLTYHVYTMFTSFILSLGMVCCMVCCMVCSASIVLLSVSY